LRPDFHAWVSILIGCKLNFVLRHFEFEFLVRLVRFGFLVRRLRFNFVVRFVRRRFFVGNLGFFICCDKCFGERRSICEG